MNATGVILAGGNSSRMRANKAFLEVGGQRIIDNILDKLIRTFDEVVLVANDAELYGGFVKEKVRLVSDVYRGKGPLAGIHSGLYHARNDLVFMVPCDMPFLNMDLAQHMVGLVGEHHGVVPRIGDFFQPLCAAYSKRCLSVIEAEILLGHLKISGVYELLDIVYLEEDQIRRFGDPAVLFYNVNNRDDLQMAEAIG